MLAIGTMYIHFIKKRLWIVFPTILLLMGLHLGYATGLSVTPTKTITHTVKLVHTATKTITLFGKDSKIMI